MKTATRFKDLPRTYRKLVEILPPRPIHDGDQYEEVREMIEALAGHDLNEDQDDYLDALSTFFEAYENDHHPIDTSKRTPLDRLKFLMEQNDITPYELGKLLGDATVGYKVLSGDRGLSKAHIKKLSERFGLSPGLFM